MNVDYLNTKLMHICNNMGSCNKIYYILLHKPLAVFHDELSTIKPGIVYQSRKYLYTLPFTEKQFFNAMGLQLYINSRAKNIAKLAISGSRSVSIFTQLHEKCKLTNLEWNCNFSRPHSEVLIIPTFGWHEQEAVDYHFHGNKLTITRYIRMYICV